MEGGYPVWGNPRSGRMGVPPPVGLDGVPHPGDSSSTASTCYAVGGMPFAFTQEDFLVFTIKILKTQETNRKHKTEHLCVSIYSV